MLVRCVGGYDAIWRYVDVLAIRTHHEHFAATVAYPVFDNTVCRFRCLDSIHMLIAVSQCTDDDRIRIGDFTGCACVCKQLVAGLAIPILHIAVFRASRRFCRYMGQVVACPDNDVRAREFLCGCLVKEVLAAFSAMVV